MASSLALIITCNPDKSFFSDLSIFLKEFSRILIIDNHSNDEIQKLLLGQQSDNIEVILNQENLGVATALNQGFVWALKRGFDCVVTFDHDSFPQQGAIQNLRKVFVQANTNKLAIVASVIEDPKVQKQARFLRARNKWMFERVFCERKELENISFAITAGSLYSLNAYQQIGAFQDNFFIDYVDEEYGLRANQQGYKIVVACDAKINHRLGEREKRNLLGRAHYPTFHSPLRWYYISRNRIPMLKKYAVRFPHWFFYEVIASTYTFLRMIIFEGQRLKKLHAIFMGTRDGIFHRMGKASDEIQQKLS